MRQRYVSSIMMGLLFIVMAVIGICFALELHISNRVVGVIVAASLIGIGLVGISLSQKQAVPRHQPPEGESHVGTTT